LQILSASGKYAGITLHTIQFFCTHALVGAVTNLQAEIAPNTAAFAKVCFSLHRTKNNVRIGRRP